MGTNNISGKTIDVTENMIGQRKALKPVMFSILLMLIGAGCLFAATTIEDKTTSAYLSLVSLGWVGIATGIIKIVLGCNEKIYKPTGSPICIHEIYFSSAGLATLNHALENKEFDQIRKIMEHEGKNARLDLWVSKDGRFISAQIFEYVPYNYQPTSPIYQFTDDEASAFYKVIMPLFHVNQ